MRLNNTVYSDPNSGVTLHWLWTQMRKIAVAGESWFVVSLVGMFAVVQSRVSRSMRSWTPDRYLHWGKCGPHIHHNRVAFRPQDGVLLRRLVAKPAVLLLGNRHGRQGL